LLTYEISEVIGAERADKMNIRPKFGQGVGHIAGHPAARPRDFAIHHATVSLETERPTN